MDPHRVVIVGDSLFAETLTHMLTSSGAVVVIGVVATVAEVLPLLQVQRPDAVIVAETAAVDHSLLGPLMAMAPDLSIIRANLNSDYVQVITSQRIGARLADLLAALMTLPRRA
ncbi:MAG: hypothetical protein U0350_30165 [Caldilineaceae bacterium]